MIRWASRAQWKAVPLDRLAATDRAFVAALEAVIPVDRCDDMDVIG